MNNNNLNNLTLRFKVSYFFIAKKIKTIKYCAIIKNNKNKTFEKGKIKMDKIEQKFKKFVLANKILATIFSAICVCSIVLFAICVANCPNWIVYVLVFLLCAILPVCIFLSIRGIDLGYFKKTKLELFEGMKDFYTSALDVDVTKFDDFDDWKDFYRQIDFEKLKRDAVNQAKKIFAPADFTSLKI